jgi:hypothetical protein
MAKIVIKDLEKLEELDVKAMSRTYGGNRTGFTPLPPIPWTFRSFFNSKTSLRERVKKYKDRKVFY